MFTDVTQEVNGLTQVVENPETVMQDQARINQAVWELVKVTNRVAHILQVQGNEVLQQGIQPSWGRPRCARSEDPPDSGQVQIALDAVIAVAVVAMLLQKWFDHRLETLGAIRRDRVECRCGRGDSDHKCQYRDHSVHGGHLLPKSSTIALPNEHATFGGVVPVAL